MHILMMTNTYLPHVGGVARSVASFSTALRQRGHRVTVGAPTFDNTPPTEENVVRFPALQNFNGSDFSVRLPVPGILSQVLEETPPDLVHSHHPFLLGDNAVLLATQRNLPLVFTHHTMYERYTHYVPGDSEAMQRFAIHLATEYANLCDQVIAPSQSIAEILVERGVLTPVAAIPTGIDPRQFAAGNRRRGRRRHAIPEDAWVVGHVGRLAPEKNLPFLSHAVARFLKAHDDAHFLVAGRGDEETGMREIFDQAGLGGRLHLAGELDGAELADVYQAMDTFAFASQTETQGMVLVEAMAAGVPVVAVDAPGAREVVADRENGRLLAPEDEQSFALALAWVADRDDRQRERLQQAALEAAKRNSLDNTTDRLLEVYRGLVGHQPKRRDPHRDLWSQALTFLATEWKLWSAKAEAAAQALREAESRE